MYIKNKYCVWYNNIISRAKNRNIAGYVERHHILPLSCGGEDIETNIVLLTAREHYICHLLLTKMLTGENRIKMISAAWFLAGKNTKKSNRIYQTLREQRKILVGPKISKTMKGVKYPPERCSNIQAAKKGQTYKPRTPEHIEKLSKAKKGKTWVEIYGEEGAAKRLAQMKLDKIHLRKKVN